jgi:hygromycin-B 7''-O-kinase
MLPEVLWVDPDNDETERAVTLMTRLPGVPLSSVIDSINGAQSYEVYRELGKVARQLHTLEQPAFGYIVTDVLDPATTNREYMARQFAKKTTALGRLDGDDGLADAIRRVVALPVPSWMRAPCRCCATTTCMRATFSSPRIVAGGA